VKSHPIWLSTPPSTTRTVRATGMERGGGDKRINGGGSMARKSSGPFSEKPASAVF